MARVRCRLSEFLEVEGISVYRLHAELSGRISRTGLYKIARSETSGIDFQSLADILTALESLLGKRVEIKDLLVYMRDGSGD